MIYVIEAGDGGPVKIGVAVNPKSRLRELQTGNPEKLRLLAEVDLADEYERLAHVWLKEFRMEGEWFRRTPEVDAAIRDFFERAQSGADKSKWFLFKRYGEVSLVSFVGG